MSLLGLASQLERLLTPDVEIGMTIALTLLLFGREAVHVWRGRQNRTWLAVLDSIVAPFGLAFLIVFTIRMLQIT